MRKTWRQSLEKGMAPHTSRQQFYLILWPGESHGQSSLAGYSVHGIAKSQTRVSDFHFHFCIKWCLNTFVWEISLHLLPKVPTPWIPFHSLSVFTLKPFRIKSFLLGSRKSRISQVEETYIWFNCESVMQVLVTALASLNPPMTNYLYLDIFHF